MVKAKTKIERLELQAVTSKIKEYLVSENYISEDANKINGEFILLTIFEVLSWYFDIKD